MPIRVASHCTARLVRGIGSPDFVKSMDWLVAVDGLAPLDHFNAMLPRTWGVRTEDCVSKTHSYIYCTVGYVSQYSSSDCCCCRSPTHFCTLTRNDALSTRSNIFLFATSPLDRLTIKAMSKSFLLAERGFDPRTSGLWAQHASTAPLCLAMRLGCKSYIKQAHAPDRSFFWLPIISILLQYAIDSWQPRGKNVFSPAGNRTPVSRVTGGDTYHYTTEDTT